MAFRLRYPVRQFFRAAEQLRWRMRHRWRDRIVVRLVDSGCSIKVSGKAAYGAMLISPLVATRI